MSIHAARSMTGTYPAHSKINWLMIYCVQITDPIDSLIMEPGSP